MSDKSTETGTGAATQEGQATETNNQGQEGATVDVNSLLADPSIKSAIDSMIDKRVSQAVKTNTERVRDEERKAAEKQRLLEKEEYKSLYENAIAEAEAAKKEKQALEYRDEMNRLLDKKEVTDPTLREIIMNQNLSVEDAAPQIDMLKKSLNLTVATTVDKRLETNAPVADGEAQVNEPKSYVELDPVRDKDEFFKQTLQRRLERNPYAYIEPGLKDKYGL